VSKSQKKRWAQKGEMKRKSAPKAIVTSNHAGRLPRYKIATVPEYLETTEVRKRKKEIQHALLTNSDAQLS
jgi:hypothetical protein